jgi:hypothetical protein
MAVEKSIPLPANVRVHPEPHVPQRGDVRVQALDEGRTYVRREGDYLVTYHRPFFVRLDAGAAIYSLAAPVLATWKRVERSSANG